MEKSSPIVFVDRATGREVVESVMGSGALSFAYETLLGRTLWPVLFGSRVVSALFGLYYDSRFSRKAITALARRRKSPSARIARSTNFSRAA